MLKQGLNKLRDWFSKGDEDLAMQLPENELAAFILKVDDIDIGELHCEDGEWVFEYTDEFKSNEEYKRIIGFPKLDQKYTKKTLWPFFRIRIPGLKQPAVKEIIEDEGIDVENEVALLKRFGRETISNPYILEVA